MNKKVVIIGGVAGGASVATRLRRLDEAAEIILFERGPYISYANCGLPYHIGNVIRDRDALLVQSVKNMTERFRIDVRTESEVLSIDKDRKIVAVRELRTGRQYEEGYDKLVISTGSTPLRPPIEGIDSEGIFTLWTITDMDRIKAYITDKKPKRAAVIGGGFIGLEMAENLRHLGCSVSVVEMLDQVMAPMDFEMAQIVHDHLRANGVELLLKDGVGRFERKDGEIVVTLQSGHALHTDIVILSIGIRPNGELAKNAGLAVNSRGGVLVDRFLKTSHPDIYAVGDVIEVDEFVLKGKASIPLAGPANKQARICADNLSRESGPFEEYNGTQGTSAVKVFDLTAASTGLNEKALMALGKQRGTDYETVVISQKSHAGYYPGSSPMQLKLLFEKTGKIFGAQIVGQDGVDKRIDTISTVMRLGGGIQALKELELAYAPPYSSAKDPVNMLGFVAENIINGLVRFLSPVELDRDGKYTGKEEYTIVDVGEEAERLAFSIGGSVHIPFGSLRERLSELDPERLVIVICSIGVRSYSAARILMGRGFKNVAIYPAGSSFYKTLYHDTLQKDGAQEERKADKMDMPVSERRINASVQVDCSGLQCPGPIMKIFSTLKDLKDGEIIEVKATDLGFARDVEAWCKRTGNTLLGSQRVNKETVVLIQKGTGVHDAGEAVPAGNEPSQGKTLIVFSGDLDRVIASFIIANGAAAMGRPVTMFFTFWGLNVLRKPERQGIKKPLIEAMFGKMMPRGAGRLKLSKMNMGGMGTAMMKKVMRDKNVDSLQELMRHAMENGVRIVACTMSMDVMGITGEELIDGVELAGVGAYLADAEDANVNLFI